MVTAFERQVDRHYSRTPRCPGGTEVGNHRSACVSFSPCAQCEGAARRMSGSSLPSVTNSGSGSDSAAGPRQVMNVAVLAESELGSEAQRERRKRILDATLAIASRMRLRRS